MRKVLGVLTEDFRLYHDLVTALKARDVPFRSLSLHDPIPRDVGVILTSPEEAPHVRFPEVVPCEDIADAVARALQILRGRRRWRELVVGVDPGAAPGIAFLGDGDVIDTRVAGSPEEVASVVRSALLGFPTERVRLRIGHGDPTNRNRIINALAPLGLPVEIVDEKGTTHRTPSPDADAAVEIARSRGVRAARYYTVEPTPGEVREVQRQSRLTSEGRVTISTGLARRVARGELTLGEAIECHRRSREGRA
ncbi:MAG: hypothetical protein HY557_08475 [Euryarchaeota archaeon]|nr:hypothetical protein [Euryarchaeota archaeon]